MANKEVENERLAYVFYQHLGLIYNLDSLFFMNENEVSMFDLLTGFKKEKALTVIIAAGLERSKRNMAVAADVVKEYLNKFGEIDSLINIICYDFKFRYHFYEFNKDNEQVADNGISHDKLLINERKLFVEVLSTYTDIGYKIDEALSQDFNDLKYVKYISSKKQEEKYNALSFVAHRIGLMTAIACFGSNKYPKEPERFDFISQEKLKTRSEQVEDYITKYVQLLGENKEQAQWLYDLVNIKGEEEFLKLFEHNDVVEVLKVKQEIDREEQNK